MPAVLWLARDRLLLGPPAGPHQYALSVNKPAWQPLGEDGTWETDDPAEIHHINASLWHEAGGTRLKPGEGPVRVTLELRCLPAGGTL